MGVSNRAFHYYRIDGLSARSALAAGGAAWMPIK
jgi:hypothetical protein